MGFQCQQFYIKDDQCAMKVSTDSLLLGSYADVTGVRRVLDMGTGCGLLALMLAQRAPNAMIEAFDADPMAIAQARDNVERSPWPKRIQVATSCVTQWQSSQPYDLIVCNPPYFAQHLASVDSARKLARQGEVTPEQWVACAARALRAHGKLYWVLPVAQATQWRDIAVNHGFHLCAELTIKTRAHKPAKLVIQGWQRAPTEQYLQESLTIHAGGGGYSHAFRELTGDFYLAGRSR